MSSISTVLRHTSDLGVRIRLTPGGKLDVQSSAPLPPKLLGQIRENARALRNHLHWVDSLPVPTVIRNRDQARALIADLVEQGQPIGVDLETTHRDGFRELPEAGLSIATGRVRLIQITDGDRAWVVDCDETGAEVAEGLSEHPGPVISHNALFDGHWFDRAMKWSCTMTRMSFLSSDTDRSLAAAARLYLGVDLDKSLQTSDWSGQLTDEQLRYAVSDVVASFRIWHEQECHFTDETRTAYQRTVDAAFEAVRLAMRTGVAFDFPRHRRVIAQWQIDKFSIESEVRRQVGSTVKLTGGPTLGQWLDDHISPPDSWERTASGHLSVTQSMLKKHAHLNAVIPDLLRYKRLQKRLSAYGEKLLHTESTGRIWPSFRLFGARTGRMSSSNPSMQQIPNGDDVRGSIVAGPGRMLVAADYSQIELRMAAVLSGDRKMLDAFRQGQDLHRLTGSIITGKELDDITPAERKAAKVINFASLYGAGAEGLHAQLWEFGFSREQVVRMLDRFWRGYPDLARFREEARGHAEQTLNVPMLSGRRQYYAERKMSYKALNSIVQGSCADLLLIAIGEVYSNLSDLDAHIVLLVHDEIVVDVADKDRDAASSALADGMRTAWNLLGEINDEFLRRSEFMLPQLVDVSVGARYSEMENV